LLTTGIQQIFAKIWDSKAGLSITAGILLGISFPPVPLPFLVIPAWILLFRLADITTRGREAAYYSYISFVIWNLITTYWLMLATTAGGIAAILANSVVMSIPFVIQHKFQRIMKAPWMIALLQASVWISYEFLHHHWDLAWPWLSLGNAWANVPELVQYISFTGYLGISFWVLLIASLVYQGIKKSSGNLFTAATAIALIFPAISLVQYSGGQFPQEKNLETVVVQPNLDSYQEYGGLGTSDAVISLLLQMSDSLRTPATELYVWPENSIRSLIYSRKDLDVYSDQIKMRLLRKAEQWDATIIGGATYLDFFTPDSVPQLSRRFRGKVPFLYYNAGLGFQPDSTMEIYRKHNLVPIVERVPFVHFLAYVDLFDWVNWVNIQGYGKGVDPNGITVDGTQTPALVCYDSVFPSWVRRYIREGSGLITVITNDGWWGNTSGHEQHWAYARLRAIEFRRWIVRSANNGISGIIDPYGDIKVETQYWDRTAFRYNVPVLDFMTFYARWGDWFPMVMLIITFIGLGGIFRRGRYNQNYRNKNKEVLVEDR